MKVKPVHKALTANQAVLVLQALKAQRDLQVLQDFLVTQDLAAWKETREITVIVGSMVSKGFLEKVAMQATVELMETQVLPA